MTVWPIIEQDIRAATGQSIAHCERHPIGGGCISAATRLRCGDHTYFVKLVRGSRTDMFAAESEGLREIEASKTVSVPTPICFGAAEGSSYLVLSFLQLQRPDTATYIKLGQQLASMHRVIRNRFGWHRDNTLGTTPQPNLECDDWVTFYRDRRLAYQLEVAARNGYTGRLQQLGEAILVRVGEFFPGYTPRASLLHGDLWSGNHGADDRGNPVIFDPAVYYGDRETDLAMTELFGGYPEAFYDGYASAYPVDPGYTTRKDLYNLYHVLNHLNLFGGGYLSQAEHLMKQLMSKVR